jgi:hypothetical protein
MRRELALYERIPLPLPAREPITTESGLPPFTDVPYFDSQRWRAELEEGQSFRVGGITLDTELGSIETTVKVMISGGFWVSLESLRDQDMVARAQSRDMAAKIRAEAIRAFGITVEDVLNATGGRR